MPLNPFSKYYHQIFPMGNQIDFISKRIEKQATILDAGCAGGQLSIQLAQQNHQVYGIDLSEEMIKVAQANSPSLSNLEIKKMDILKLQEYFQRRFFDAVICIGNVLALLQNEKAVKKAIQNFDYAMKPQSTVILQILNYEFLYRNKIETLPRFENEEIIFERKNELLPHRVQFHKKLTIKKSGSVIEEVTPAYPIKLNTLMKIIKQETNWESVQLFGSFKGDSFAETSLPLILVAHKKG